MANEIAQALLLHRTQLWPKTKAWLCNSRPARSLSQCPEKSQDGST